MGSVGASLYRRGTTHALLAVHLPHAVSTQSLDSVGSALTAAQTLSPTLARTVSNAATRAFIHGLDIASLVGFAVAVGGAFVAWRFLPTGMTTGAPAPAVAPQPGGLQPVHATVPAEA
jgi:hypothetical protein